jgi:hypothetical protein
MAAGDGLGPCGGGRDRALLLALLLVFLGRMRTWRAVQKFIGKDTRRDPRYPTAAWSGFLVFTGRVLQPGLSRRER